MMEQPTDPTVTLEPIPVPDSTGPQLYALSSLVSALEADGRNRYEAKRDGRPLGPVPPFPKLAKAYGGALPDGVHIMLGGSGVGKTALALQISSLCGCPALYVSVEMAALELMRRLCARNSRTFLNKYKDGTLLPNVIANHANMAAEAFPHLCIADATTGYASPEWIEEKARAIRGNSEHLLIVIDSLHAWANTAPSDKSEYELISWASQQFREMAARLKCPVLAISEMNRASSNSKDTDDKIGAGAGSRKIEYGSESVIYLKADTDEATGPDGNKPINLTFAKNRHGAKGDAIQLMFNGAFQTYAER
jgi:replicative DNA helicase